MMRWLAAAALALIASGCGQKTEQAPTNQAAVPENPAPETNVSSDAAEPPATENSEANASTGNLLGTLPPTNATLRFVGRWAKDEASCTTKPWTFTKNALTATGGPDCSIYDVKKVLGGYDLAVQCPAKKPDPTDLIKLRFAESARAMLVESNAIEPMGLIYCGK
jgi:hypothetical protein